MLVLLYCFDHLQKINLRGEYNCLFNTILNLYSTTILHLFIQHLHQKDKILNKNKYLFNLQLIPTTNVYSINQMYIFNTNFVSFYH